MKTQKERLDKEILRRGLADTRQRAQGLILSGKVTVDGVRVDKAGAQVSEESAIALIADDMPYVSRGGLKLKGALDAFGLDVSGLICADVGASTGGFTDCLLQEGASRVYALDVGYGLIDSRLRNDPRVTVIERVNVRHMEPGWFDGPVDMATVDVSFISLKLVLGPIASVLRPGGIIVALVKPQFEVGKGKVGRGGIVRDESERLRALTEVMEFAASTGLIVGEHMESPITGAKGNVEYLLRLEKKR
ncbi:MAG: TlyA family RNA methyltransferase [Nitrospirae bacterium]|nr:TlyA family RNA methyltransferase [Nitrospirota bacterium]MBI5696313.1 TlyA family RNA methyltransferase [Nitrospirota bacterium]